MKDQLRNILFLVVLAFLPNFAAPCHGQLIFPGDDHKQGIPLNKFHELIAEPGGLVELTNIIGDFTVGSPSDRCWGGMDLPEITKKSTLAITAMVGNAEGFYTPENNGIFTIYTLQVLGSLKGNAGPGIKLKVDGGRARLSNGHFATMHTLEFDKLKLGDTYVLFLSRTAEGYRPTYCSQGMYRVSNDSQIVHAIDPFATQLPGYRVYEGAQIQGLESEIRALAAQQ